MKKELDMGFIKQCKGKDLNKVPKSKLDEGDYFCSVKYDGNYVQIHKFGDEVTFYTSSGKPFKIKDLEKDLIQAHKDIDFILESEYIGRTDGKLGSRGECTTTTFRTNTSKGIHNYAPDVKFMIFDALYLSSSLLTIDFIKNDDCFYYRKLMLESWIMDTPQVLKVKFFNLKLKEAKDEADAAIKFGAEGLFIKKSSHRYKAIGRCNDAIKLKSYPRKTLVCVGTKPGEGKYEGMIGSLILLDGDNLVYVSGFSDDVRAIEPTRLKDALVTFEYESFNKTYVQSRVKEIVYA